MAGLEEPTIYKASPTPARIYKGQMEVYDLSKSGIKAMGATDYDPRDATRFLEDLRQRGEQGDGSSEQKDAHIVSKFFDRKGRDCLVSTEAAKAIRDPSKPWPVMLSITGNNSQHALEFTLGVILPHAAVKPQSIDFLLGVRKTLNEIAKMLGADGRALLHAMAKMPPTANVVTMVEDERVWTAIKAKALQDKSTRPEEAAQTCVEGVNRSLLVNWKLIPMAIETRFKNFSYEVQLEAQMAMICAELLGHVWDQVRYLESYPEQAIGKTPPPSARRFAMWDGTIRQMAYELDNLGLNGTAGMAAPLVREVFRMNLQKLNREGDEIIDHMTKVHPMLLMDKNIDVLEFLRKAAEAESILADATRSSAPQDRRALNTIAHGKAAGRVTTLEEWKQLSDAEKKALASADITRGTRPNFRHGPDGKPIWQFYCPGPKGGGGCRWVNQSPGNMSLAEHKKKCPHFVKANAKTVEAGVDVKQAGGRAQGLCDVCKQKGHKSFNCPMAMSKSMTALSTILQSHTDALANFAAASAAQSAPSTPASSISVPTAVLPHGSGVAKHHSLFTDRGAVASAGAALLGTLGKSPTPSSTSSATLTHRTYMTLRSPNAGTPTSVEASAGGVGGCYSGLEADDIPEDDDYEVRPDVVLKPFGWDYWHSSIGINGTGGFGTLDDFDTASSAPSGVTVPRNFMLRTMAAKTPDETDELANKVMRVIGEFEALGIKNTDIWQSRLEQEVLIRAGRITMHTTFSTGNAEQDANLEAARHAVGWPGFTCEADIDRFLKLWAMVYDNGSNLTLVNRESLLKDMGARNYVVGTVDDRATILKSGGTLHAQALLRNGRGTIKLPAMETALNEGGPTSVLAGFSLRKEHKGFVDSCTDPSDEMLDAGGRAFVSVRTDLQSPLEELLLIEYKDLCWVVVLPINDDSEAIKNVHAYSTRLTSHISSSGAPGYEDIVLQGSGVEASDGTNYLGDPEEAMPTREIKGRLFTLAGEDDVDPFFEVEQTCQVEEVHLKLADYHHAIVNVTTRGGTSTSAKGGAVRPPKPAPVPTASLPAHDDEESEEELTIEEFDWDDEASPVANNFHDGISYTDSTGLAGSLGISSSRPWPSPGDHHHVCDGHCNHRHDGHDSGDVDHDLGRAGDGPEEDNAYLASNRAKLKTSRISLIEWHSILGHAGVKTVRATLASRGFRAFDDDGGPAPFHCDTCAVANTRKKHVNGLGMRRDKVPEKPGEVLCIDVMHLDDVESLTGLTKVLLWVDHKSGMCGIAPYSLNPHEVSRYRLGGVILRVILEVRRLSGFLGTILIHSDLGLDEINVFTEEETAAIGAIQHGGAAYHSNTNPLPEVYIRILRDKARAFAIAGGLPPAFMYIMLKQAAEIQNDLIGNDGTSPRMRFTGQMRASDGTFDAMPGQLCFAYRVNNQGASKQEARGHAVIYLGRGSIVRQVGYLVYDPIAMRVYVTPSIRFAKGPFETKRFPYMEGLWVAVAKLARKELKSEHIFVQPYDKVLPNGMYAHELIKRKVMVRKKKGKGHDIGTVASCRYTHGGALEDLVFDVIWEGAAAREKENTFNFEELAPMLVDDSGVEAMISLYTTSSASAEAIMSDATRYGSMYFAAKQAGTGRYPRGMINETTFTCVSHALKYAKTEEERVKWREALDKELRRLFVDHDVFEWVSRPRNYKPMRLNFPCKIKKEGDLHNSERVVYKVRCVGGTTKKEIEGTSGVPLGGWQSFAATIAQSQFLHFLAICVELGLELRSLDVQGAYLNAEAPRDHMYYEPPACITPPDPNKPYLRAKKALYGYAESGRAWYLHWNKILKDIGFKACDRNSTWLTRTTSDGVAMVGTVVDDCVFGVSSETVWVKLLAEIRKHVGVDAGPLEMFIGVACKYEKDKGRLQLNQTHLIELAMTRFGINDQCQRYTTPMETTAVVSILDSPDVADPADVLTMQSMLGTYQYLTITRPEIKTAVNLLARIASNPSKSHLKMARRVLMYLAHTKHVPLVFSKTSWYTPDGLLAQPGQILCFVDASFADSGPEYRMKSRHGFALMRAGAVFATKTSMQTLTAGSSCQAETVALYMAAIEIQAALQDLERLGLPHVGPVLVFEDNQAAISVMGAAGTSSGSNSRHFLTKYFYTADLVEAGAIKLVKVNTLDQLADGFTKALCGPTHERHRHFLLGHQALSAEELKALGLPSFTPASR